MSWFTCLFACVLVTVVHGGCNDVHLPLVLPTLLDVLHYPPSARHPHPWHVITLRSDHPVRAAWALQKQDGNTLKNVIVKENDADFVSMRIDNGNVISFAIKPFNPTHNLQHFQNLWFGLKVNFYDCHVVHVDLHFHKDLGQNVTRRQELGKIFTLPQPDKLVTVGSSHKFAIEVTQGLNRDEEDKTVIFDSVADIFFGSKIAYNLRPDYTHITRIPITKNGERAVGAEYTMNPVTKSHLGMNRFFYNIKYMAGDSVRDAMVSIMFSLRDRSDSAPAVGISPCFTASRKTFHEDRWPVIPRETGYNACIFVQTRGKPRPEVAFAITDRSTSQVQELMTGLYGLDGNFSSVGPYDDLRMFVLPPSREEAWAVVAVQNEYKYLNIKVKIAPIERTEVVVSTDSAAAQVKLTCSSSNEHLVSVQVYKAETEHVPPPGSFSRPEPDVLRHWTSLGPRTSSGTVHVILTTAEIRHVSSSGEQIFCAAIGQHDLALQAYDLSSW